MKTQEAQSIYTVPKKSEQNCSTLPVFKKPEDLKLGDITQVFNENGISEKIVDFKTFKIKLEKIVKESQNTSEKINEFLKFVKNGNQVSKIVGVDFNVEYILILSRTITNRKFLNQEGLDNYIWLLKEICQTKNFQTVVKQMLGKNDKMVIRNQFRNLDFDEELINKFIA